MPGALAASWSLRKEKAENPGKPGRRGGQVVGLSYDWHRPPRPPQPPSIPRHLKSHSCLNCSDPLLELSVTQ